MDGAHSTLEKSESLTIKIVRTLFVLVIGTMAIIGEWIIDRYYDIQMWWFWFKIKH